LFQALLVPGKIIKPILINALQKNMEGIPSAAREWNALHA
jgi:hypothetical protein